MELRNQRYPIMKVVAMYLLYASAKNYPASDTAPLRPDARDVESASPASCAP